MMLHILRVRLLFTRQSAKQFPPIWILKEFAMSNRKQARLEAKQFIDSSLVKKASRLYKIAYLIPIAQALGAAGGVALGVKVKDAIAKPRPVDAASPQLP